MAKSILVANWKNNPSSLAEAEDILGELSRKKLLYKKVSLFIAPPEPFLEVVSRRTKGLAQLGTQDIIPVSKGTYTGVVSVDILKSFGVKLAILGHSERRALGETSEQVAEKVRFALRNGLVPLVCVGEKVRDNDGEHFEFLREQIRSSLMGLSKQGASSVLLAYEPVWAVGKNATGALEAGDLSQSVVFIKKVLTELYDRKTAEGISILYGGSVDPVNAGALLREGGVRGLLVGRASLNAKSFSEIASSLTQK